jgi:hypothetical protein
MQVQFDGIHIRLSRASQSGHQLHGCLLAWEIHVLLQQSDRAAGLIDIFSGDQGGNFWKTICRSLKA